LPRPSRIGKREAPTAKWRLAIVEGELEGQLFHMEHETEFGFGFDRRIGQHPADRGGAVSVAILLQQRQLCCLSDAFPKARGQVKSLE